ncbi:Putative toxin-antitoxin system, toxin component, type II BrnT [Desulfonema magnum]|uniref:Toxin-antitoxin system, toxin component, type II BrnT n=1 Tax=Desulfonema magnum TaxID=45655 RepID=A0A975BGR1_9BACT|nr:Putative toxin-antitoxin system, toxin component, type II BrnT [Desulfonema magnum]
MKYHFEWDKNKAKGNKRKHKIGFQRAVTVFRDHYMISIFDDEHSETEDRWITLGTDETGVLIVISHTFHKISSSQCNIRIISACKATKTETNQYKESIL